MTKAKWQIFGLVVLVTLLLCVFADKSATGTGLFFGYWRTRHMVLILLLVVFAVMLWLASHSKKAFFSGVFVLLLGSVTLLLFELVGVLRLVDYGVRFGNDRTLSSSILGSSPLPDADISGETFQDIATLRGLDHDSISFRFQTGKFGYRNSSQSARATMFLLGDSILVGGLVAFEDTVAGKMEDITASPVMNVALNKISPQEAIALFSRLDRLEPGVQVVQFVFEGNDLADSRAWRNSSVDRVENGPDLLTRLKRQSFVYNLVLWLQRITGPDSRQQIVDSMGCQVGKSRYEFLWGAQSFAGLEDEAVFLLDALARFGKQVEDSEGRYYVVFVPSKLRVLIDFCEPGTWTGQPAIDNIGPLRQVVNSWGSHNGITVIDLTEALKDSASGGEIPWFWGDTHWNSTGHAVAARVVADAISDHQRSLE